MTIETSMGTMYAAVDENGALTELRFGAEQNPDNGTADSPVARQLAEYFSGARKSFDLPAAPEGTEFQKRVWAELTRIPYGETISYAELAKRVGRPGAARAVGRANATNPIAIVVPCHRVIGADGTLTGYAYGVERKRALLDLERGQGQIQKGSPPH